MDFTFWHSPVEYNRYNTGQYSAHIYMQVSPTEHGPLCIVLEDDRLSAQEKAKSLVKALNLAHSMVAI